MTVLGPHYDGKHTGFAKQYCYYVKSYYRKSFNNWHQSAASTSQTGIILQPTSNLHASLWNIPKQEVADYLTPWVWTEHTRSAITWPGLGGLALFLDLALPRPRSRLFSQGQDQGQRPEVPRPRPSWGVLEDPRGQGQASRTTRLLIPPYIRGWMRFDVLNRLGVDHKCDRQTDGRTDK